MLKIACYCFTFFPCVNVTLFLGKLNFPVSNISTTTAAKINLERVDGNNQGITLTKTVPFLQNTNNSLKKSIAIDCSKIIETICYVTNTLPPSYNDHNTLFHIITTQHGMVTRNSHYSNLALDTNSHCGPIFKDIPFTFHEFCMCDEVLMLLKKTNRLVY